MKVRMIDHNPVELSDRVKVPPAERSNGFHTWTEPEITKYRNTHRLGSKARLAMELILWTDQRGIDAIHLGPQHIQAGRLGLSQSKTGRGLRIKVAEPLWEAINAMEAGRTGEMCFLINDLGRPFSRKGFGNKFRTWCDQAGLPQCSAHGLRKATMRRMADIGMGNQQMKAISGHVKDDEVARYTREANQMELADSAINQLSEWELSNHRAGLDTQPKKGTGNAG